MEIKKFYGGMLNTKSAVVRFSKNPAFVFSLVFLALVFTFALAIAHDNSYTFCTSTDNYSIRTDKDDYHPEDMVHIQGTGFSAEQQITIKVIRPDGTSSTGSDPYTPWPTDYDTISTD